jgi:hypothetical protein
VVGQLCEQRRGGLLRGGCVGVQVLADQHHGRSDDFEGFLSGSVQIRGVGIDPHTEFHSHPLNLAQRPFSVTTALENWSVSALEK